MNLFSQSKLTLKLKKPNSTLSSASTNESQKQDISDPLKLGNSTNDSVISVNDSFVEVLPTIQSHNENISVSQNCFMKSNQNEYCSIKNENKLCPVCLVMIGSKNFINHVKSCGTSHNVSSEVLIKAVDLQERQTAEREALGLPKVFKKKKKKKNSVKKSKIGSDSNLDLAIAMSASLQESKEAEIIRESETLLEAGLEKEAIDKRKTLECFGFISNQPVKPKSKVFKTNSILFKQSKEDREKRITEKVAMILVDSYADTNVLLGMLTNCSSKNIRSKYLNNIRNCNNKLWKKSSLEGDNYESEFYVDKLSKFIIPSESNSFTDSKNILELSTHQTNVSKRKPNTLHSTVNNTNFVNDSVASPNIVENKTMSEYSSKWKSMVGNQSMSDIVFITQNEHEIHAHMLVLYVQCPDILNDIVIEESDSYKSKKMVMWLDYSYRSCLAFLEYIYSGQESIVSLEYREDYLNLQRRYNIPIILNNENHEYFSEAQNNISKRQIIELNNSPTTYKRFKSSSPDMFMPTYDFLGAIVNDEQSLKKTRDWLNSFKENNKYPSSSFTENSPTDVPPKTNFLDTSSNHSFHSASTVSINTYIQNTSNHINNNNIKSDDICINSLPNINGLTPKLLSTDESRVKPKKNRSVPCPVITRAGMPPLANTYEIPELIIIPSDSESESIDMSLSINCNNRHDNLLSCTTFKKHNLPFNSNKINAIELDDSMDSIDSIHSAITNILNQKNYNRKSHNSLFEDSSTSNSKNKSLASIYDGRSVFSAVTNVISSNNNIKIIDLVDDSSTSSISAKYASNLFQNDDSMTSTSTSFSNNSQLTGQNCSSSFLNSINCKENIFKNQEELNCKQIKNEPSLLFPSNSVGLTNNIFELYSNNFDKILSHCDNNDLKSISISPEHNDKSSEFLNTTSSMIMNDLSTNNQNNSQIDIDNSQNNSEIFSIEKNDLKKLSIDSKLLKNTTSTSLTSCNESDDLLVNTNNFVDLTNSSPEIMNNYPKFNTISTEVTPIQSTKFIDSNIQDKLDEDQIIWLDDNDWVPDNNAISSEYNLVLDKSQVLSPKHNIAYDNAFNLSIETPNILIDHNPMNSKKKNETTPNKYGSRINTPKSLRRVQSESVIGSKEQVTPLPDYNAMNTPDLIKEFDRYGLKDLGRRKGKLILEHIYDVLHPSNSSCTNKLDIHSESEQYSDLSDNSEHGIPDYDGESCDELETQSQTSLSNKTSVDMGFKQMLRANQDLHKQILCYKPIWIEELKEDLKQYNVSISMQKLMTFLDDKCVTFRSRSLNNQRQKAQLKRTRRKKLF